jgi:ubiquinone biosynthesis protein
MKVYWELCTENILTMEYIDGIKASNMEELKKNSIDFKAVAVSGANSFFKQIFELGFFHADPHPGNIFILPGNVIAPIDFGMIGYMDDFLQKQLGKALIAFIDRDPDALIKVLRELELIEDSRITRSLHYDIKNLINYYYNISLSQLNLGTVIFELIDIIRKHHIKIPVDLVLLAKAASTVESLGKELYPEFDIVSIAQPYVQKLLLARINPFNRFKDAANLFQDSSMFIKSLPEELHFILNKIRRDKLKVKMEVSNLDYFVKEMDKSSNRLAFSVIIASFLVGSSLVINVNKGPYLFGIPFLGFAGFIAAGILGLWLLIAIIRSGRL